MKLLTNMAMAWQRMKAAGMNPGLDAKRCHAWREYGYPDSLSFHDFYKAYQRHGVARGAVNAVADKCWESAPEIIQGAEQDKTLEKTPWETEFDRLAKQTKLFKHLKESDKRRLVGRYSALIVRAADSKPWDQELGKLGARQQVVELIPAWESELTPLSWDEVPSSPRYGLPVMYQYRQGSLSCAAQPINLEIHHSRVIIIGDIRSGESFLQAGYNALIDLEKITGGSGESYLKNGARQLAVEYNNDTSPVDLAEGMGTSVEGMHEALSDFVRDINAGNESMLNVFGGTVKPLTANVPDPEPHFNVSLQTFCAAIQVPSKIIVGNQTGERASTEDIRSFNGRCMSRRHDLSDDIERVVQWFIEHGALSAIDEFTVIWSDLNEQSLTERLESVGKMVDANQKMLATGELVFLSEEIRQVAGYDALADVEPLGEPGEDLTGEEESPD